MATFALCSIQTRLAFCAIILLNWTLSTSSWLLNSPNHFPKQSSKCHQSTISSQVVDVSFGVRCQHPISYSLENLGSLLKGPGRAQACFDCYRMGVDPVWYYAAGNDQHEKEGHTELLGCDGWTRSQIEELMMGRVSNGLGNKTLQFLAQSFGSIEDNVSNLSKITTCSDGTTKLLLELLADGLEVETVIIPWDDRKKSTLCISSQVGCKQGCTFCATGRMGRLRSLDADEILAQLYWANKACRLKKIYPIENIVFMGLGEPADNAVAVTRAAKSIVHPKIFQLPPRKVTISTVAPTPEAFDELGKSEVVLAWSVHAARDELRRRVVPTTRFPMAELRAGLIRTLQSRRKKLRNTMLEITLLDQINDSEEDAMELVKFCKPLLDEVDGIKLIVNLIPWNDIKANSGPASTYRKPSMQRVMSFQQVLVQNGVMCYVRTTRGDEEDAACGMLSTKKKILKS